MNTTEPRHAIITECLIITIAARCNARLKFGDAARAADVMSEEDAELLATFADVGADEVRAVLNPEVRNGIKSAVLNHTSASPAIVEEIANDTLAAI